MVLLGSAALAGAAPEAEPAAPGGAPAGEGSKARRWVWKDGRWVQEAAATASEDPAAPAEKAEPAPAAEPPKEKKPLATMAPEEVLELPVFKRFDISWEKGETLLEDVKDKTYDYDEAAFYWLVAQVHKLPAALFKPDAETVPYEQLLATPTAYRGKPVTVRGLYAAVTPWRVPVIALAKEIPYLYTCHIKEHPGGAARPIATVVVLEDPMLRFQQGDEVRVKGYFYKVRLYADAEETERLAPMLVARGLEPDTGEGGPARLIRPPGAGQAWLPLALALLITLLIAFYFVRRLGRPKSDADRARLPHRIRLRRPDRPFPLEDAGPGGPESRPEQAGVPGHQPDGGPGGPEGKT
jgi:hypothetical protein